jgi:hypothetical protein
MGSCGAADVAGLRAASNKPCSSIAVAGITPIMPYLDFI